MAFFVIIRVCHVFFTFFVISEYIYIYICHIYILLNNCILAHNEFKFSVHSGTDGLEERNAPLNSKVLG